MECPHCKLSTTLEDGRCGLCGYQPIICDDCGAANEATAKHCSSCGMSLSPDPDLEAAEVGDDSAEEHHIY
jgi:hypothetical protein